MSDISRREFTGLAIGAIATLPFSGATSLELPARYGSTAAKVACAVGSAVRSGHISLSQGQGAMLGANEMLKGLMSNLAAQRPARMQGYDFPVIIMDELTDTVE